MAFRKKHYLVIILFILRMRKFTNDIQSNPVTFNLSPQNWCVIDAKFLKSKSKKELTGQITDIIKLKENHQETRYLNMRKMLEAFK